MHTEGISSLSADSMGRFLVTGSRDKTIRVWDLTKGILLRTIRPPIGPGLKGVNHAVTISPDGETVAAGGWTGNTIYIFERSTGRMVRRIPDLPGLVLQLAFTPDSKLLGASLGGENGIRIFRPSDGHEVWQEHCIGKSSFGFDASGRMATACSDGLLRLYDASFKQLAMTWTDGEPISISLSPNGHEVAVGSRGSSEIYIFSGRNLSLTYRTSPTFLSKSPFVSWSRDGMFIYSKSLIKQSWPAAGRGKPTTIGWSEANSEESLAFKPYTGLKDIEPLPENRLAFVTSNAWGITYADGTSRVYRESDAIDFQNSYPNLLTDPNGFLASFSYSPTQPAVFSVESRWLALQHSFKAGLREKFTEIPELHYWETPLTLNGRPLLADASESFLDLAITPDAYSFLLATNCCLRYYDRTGRQHWEIRPPSLAYNVTLSDNGRLALAAFGDGTIRWYRTEDGQELLAFFPHVDREHWVAWTPSGYYDTSVGGEGLLGWHVNRGPDEAADWFPASHFRERFYRPDVIARILITRDEAKALADADTKIQQNFQATDLSQLLLPPVITLLDPAREVETRKANLTFQIAVRSPSGEPVTSVRAFVDGRLVGTSRGLAFEPVNPPVTHGIDAHSTENVYKIEVPLPSRDCTVAILAETRFSTSEPVAVKVRWAAEPSVPEKPTLYLLAVGVSEYKNPYFRLELPAKDARDIASAWKRQEGGLYKKVDARLLINSEATQDSILSGLEWLENQVTQKDMAVLFFAGHGINDLRSGGYQFLPYEADMKARRTTLIPDREVISTLAGLPGKALVFLDTCYSGSLLGGLKTRDAGDMTRLINELASVDNGVVVFAASTGRQLSAESPEWKNGVFTKAVVEALNGKADLDGNRSISITEIESYVGKRLKELTGGLQTPVSHKPGGVPDFPVAVAGRP